MESPTLQLTYTVKESGTPGIFIGRINEIGGIFAQANSLAEVYSDLVRHTYLMLPYKREQVIALLQKQTQERWRDLLVGQLPTFNLEVCNEPEKQVA